MKKIFAPGCVIIAAITAAIFITMYLREGIAILNFPGGNVGYMNEAAFSPEPTEHWAISSRADSFSRFKWFTGKFGYKVTDETIAEIRILTYPELDEFIASRTEFAVFDIHDTAELTDFMNSRSHTEDYDITIPEYSFGTYLYDDAQGARIDEVTGMLNCPERLYIDKYISEDPYFAGKGISTYSEFEKYHEDVYEENGYTDEARAYTKELRNELERVSNAANDDIKSGRIVPEFDTVYEQWQHYCTCYLISRHYTETKKDPLYYFDCSQAWTLGLNHTLSEYRKEWEDMLKNATSSEYAGLESEEDYDQAFYSFVFSKRPITEAQRILERVGVLGEDYYYVRIGELFYGWTGTGFGIIILSAVLCIIFAAPYAVADKRNIVPLQYTTKCGRNIERKKLWAVVLMAVIVSLIAAIAVLIIMPHDVCAQWFGLPLTSFSAHDLLWLDVNMWQYIALYIVISFIINICTAVTAYTVCGFCGNIIAAVTVSVPLMTVELLLWSRSLSHIFSLPESAAETPLLCLGIIASAVLCVILNEKKQRRTAV